MTEEHPIDDSLNEIEKIMKFLERMKNEEVSITDLNAIKEEVEVIHKKVNLFTRETDAMLKDMGISDARLKEALETIPNDLPQGDQDALKKAMKLKDELLKLKKEMVGNSEAATPPEDDKTPKKKDKMLTKEEHMKKYNRLGSKKKWKPL